MDTLRELPLDSSDQRLLERYDEFPTNPVTLAQLAGLALRHGRSQQAEQLFTDIGESPDYDAATIQRILFIQAQFAVRMGDAEAALRLFDEASNTPGDQTVIMEATRKELGWRLKIVI